MTLMPMVLSGCCYLVCVFCRFPTLLHTDRGRSDAGLAGVMVFFVLKPPVLMFLSATGIIQHHEGGVF